jgi:hypothetical protein
VSSPLGQAVHLTHPVIDPDTGDVATPATITLTVQAPDGTTASYTPSYDAVNERYYFDLVPSTAGHYVYRWVTTSPATAREGDIDVTAAYSGDPAAHVWAPALEDVAALVPTRTVDDTGEQQDTFNDTTTPTDLQVTGFIAAVVGEVASYVGPVDARLSDTAKGVAALGAASSVELTFPPTGDVVSVATELRLRYQQSLERLRTANRAIRSSRAGSVELPLEPLKSALPTP